MNARQRRIFLSWLARISKPFTPTYAASAAEVYSSNIVGYTKVAITPGLNLLGSQYVTIGDNGDIGINEFMTSDDLAGFDDDYVFQTFLKRWTGSGYETYGYCANGQGTAEGLPSWDGKWLTYNMEALADVDMPAGKGCWLKSTDVATITVAGQVSTNDSYSVSLNSGLNLLSNPFPVPLDINTIVSDDLAGFDENYEFQTILRKWTGIGYRTYGYCGNGQGTAEGLPAWDGKWITLDFSEMAAVEIPAGNGFWIKTTSPATIKFTSPLK